MGGRDGKVKRRDEAAWLKSQAMTPIVGQRGVLVSSMLRWSSLTRWEVRRDQRFERGVWADVRVAGMAYYFRPVIGLAATWCSPDPRPSLLPVSLSEGQVLAS